MQAAGSDGTVRGCELSWMLEHVGEEFVWSCVLD